MRTSPAMRRLAPAALVAALVAGCAHAPPSQPAAPPPPAAIERPPAETPEKGIASYYARSLEGHRTASGERYRGREMTCAHRTHPFGSVLRVTDVESGRSVLVTVTDRGPFAEGRVVDLSWAAARKLGMIERGVARVRVERVR